MPKGAKLRILFEDEGRFGRISDHRRCWAPLPTRPIVGSQIVREYVYGFFAVSPFDGRCSALILPWSDNYTMSVFLKHTSEIFRKDFCVMFLDKASWHTTRQLKIPANIRLIPLPPHSPELNPVEHVWEYLRENFFGNKIFSSLDAVADSLFEGLRSLVLNAEVLKSLTNYHWLNTLCMTSK